MTDFPYKFGKKAATHRPTDLQFAHYKTSDLRQAPVGYSHAGLVQNPWGMLGNDSVGDCAIAGPGHEHMITSAAGGVQTYFKTEDILAAYSAITGYNPNDPNTDQGSNVADVLAYRKKTGLKDAFSKIHTIGAYVAFQPGDFDELLEGLEVFEAVGIGFEVPQSAMNQFNAGKPWSVVPNSPIEGGHYVPVVGRSRSELVEVVTWGRIQSMTRHFYERYCDEVWAILSPEMLTNGKSLEGFDLAALQADLTNL